MTDFSAFISQIQTASLSGIQDLARTFSAAADGPGGILYSGQVGDAKAQQIALDLANKTGVPILDNTARGQFLGDKTIQDAIQERAQALYEGQRFTSTEAKALANNFLFGDPNAPAGNPVLR